MIGKTILHYKIKEKLGEGGMGVVYKAEDTKLKRQVAIKFLPHRISENSDERKRFEIEAQAAASLNHPNIATIYAIEHNDDDIFIVMEYIDGKELREIVQSEIPNLQSAINYATQIAEGLQAAHEKGIVHRDIKSANIMITDKGQVKIMDFGLAKMGQGMQLTKEHSTLGTAAYMSPEQARGGKVDQRTDIWSVGVVLYEMLTGKLPFKGDYEQAVIYSILHDDPAPISTLNPNISPELENMIRKCLEKEVQSRFQSMTDFLSDLSSITGHPVSGTSSSNISFKKLSTKYRILLDKKIFTISILSVVLILSIVLWQVGLFRMAFGYGDIPEERHLLVLPFTSIGGDKDQTAVCNGLAEILTSKLSQLEQFHGSLWIVPFSEVRRNEISSPGEAYQSFGANLAVTGSLQLNKESYRLMLNLVDAQNLRQLNSSVIDVTKSNITQLQDKSVEKLLDMLNLELNPEEQKILTERGTADAVAYEFHLRGRGFLQRYEKAENLDAAISLFEQAVKLDSLYALAHAGLGEAYWRKYEATKDPIFVQKAASACEKAFRLNDQLAPVNVALGMLHAGTGKYEMAVQDFIRALKINPTDADAYSGLAKAYESQGLLNEAELTYKKAIELKPDYWAAYNALGAFYYRHSRYHDAILQFKMVVQLTPDNYRGYNNLGAIYYLLEHWEDAREMFARSMSIKKTSSVSSNLGTLYYIEGNYTKAARMYEIAVELNDKYYLYWGNLAAAYYWAPGERDKAKDAFHQAIAHAEEQLEINPQDAEVISQLAGYYAMVGNRTKSLELLGQSFVIAPKNVQIMYRTGTTYEQLGKREKALQWIIKALENGYSESEIEHQPELRELLADARFKEMLKNKN